MNNKKPHMRLVDSSYDPEIDKDKKILPYLLEESSVALGEVLYHRNLVNNPSTPRIQRLKSAIILESKLQYIKSATELLNAINAGKDYLKL